jgi:hypothetical protein
MDITTLFCAHFMYLLQGKRKKTGIWAQIYSIYQVQDGSLISYTYVYKQSNIAVYTDVFDCLYT